VTKNKKLSLLGSAEMYIKNSQKILYD